MTPVSGKLALPGPHWIIIPVVWVVIAILAPLLAFGNIGALAIIGLMLALAGAVVLLRWPGLGFPLLILSSLIVPLRIQTGTQTSINSSLLLVVVMIVLWLFESIGQQRPLSFIRTPVFLPAFLYILVACLAFLFGQLGWYQTRAASIFAQLGGLMILVLSMGTLLVTIHRLSDISWLKWATYLFIALGGIYIIAFAIPPLRYTVNRVFQRAVQDSLFWTWIIVLAFTQAWLNHKLPLWARAASGLVAAVGFYTVFITKQTWTSGWLPAAAAIGFVVLIKKPKLALAGVLVFALFALIRAQVLNSILLAGDNEYSLTTRLAAWRILGDIISRNPLFGLGPANYYWFTPFYDILGYSVSFNSHNNYIDIVAQTGLIGLGLILWLFAALGITGWQARHRIPQGFEQAFLYGALGGLAGTVIAGMFGDWFMPFVYNVGMDGFRSASLAWFFLGGMVYLSLHYPPNLKASP